MSDQLTCEECGESFDEGDVGAICLSCGGGLVLAEYADEVADDDCGECLDCGGVFAVSGSVCPVCGGELVDEGSV